MKDYCFFGENRKNCNVCAHESFLFERVFYMFSAQRKFVNWSSGPAYFINFLINNLDKQPNFDSCQK